MNRRDRQDPQAQQAPGGYRGDSRQASQWQPETNQQAGGGWDRDDDQRFAPGRNDLSDSPRNDLSSDARDYGGRDYGARDERADRDWRDARHDTRHDTGDAFRDRGGSSSRGRRPESDYRFDTSYGNDFGSFTSEDFGGRDFSGRRGGPRSGAAPGRLYSSGYGDNYGNHWGEGVRNDGRNDQGRNDQGRNDYGSWREYGESRGFLRRAGDEIASWFGDEDAARRREQDHSGRGPADYTRSDERIREDVNDDLTHDWRVDASEVRVTVKDGDVTLEGVVRDRQAKRRAEDLAENVSGVKHVQNNLRIQNAQNAGQNGGRDAGSQRDSDNWSAAGTALGSATGANVSAKSPDRTN